MSAEKIAIVVIGLNEEERLGAALDAAAAALQEVGGGELLYVDSGSSDRSREIAVARNCRVLSLDKGPHVAAAARNAGIQATSAPLIQFLDGDMIIDPNWLPEALRAVKENSAHATAGWVVEEESGASTFSRVCGFDWSRSTGEVETLGGATLWRRDALEALGAFDETLPVGEDPDLSLRAREAGMRLTQIGRPMVSHALLMSSIVDWWRRALSGGRSTALIRQRHPQAVGARCRLGRALRDILFLVLGSAALPWSIYPMFGAVFFWLAIMLRHAWRVSRRGARFQDALLCGLHVQFVKIPFLIGALSMFLGKSSGLETSTPTSRAAALAVLAPQLPSTSATFVYREVIALREQGARIECFSLHAAETTGIAADGMPFLSETENLYGRGIPRSLRRALKFAVSHPLRTLAIMGLAFRDALAGRFTKWPQRPKAIWQALVGLGLAKELKGRGCDHLHVHFANSAASVGMYAARAAGIGFSVTSHANDLWVEGALLEEKIERASYFRTISEANRSALIESLGPVAEKVEVLHCGVDPGMFAPSDRPRGDGAQRLLFVGRLVPKKGADLLLRAFAEIADDHPKLHLDLVGDGPESPRIEAMIQDLGLKERVSRHGALSSQEILPLLRTADVFVLPSREAHDGDRDGIPVALMEAMACGVAVVSAKIPGFEELIEDGVQGRLVDPGRLDQLTETIEDLLRNQARRESMGQKARQRIEQRFHLKKQARTLITHLQPEIRFDEGMSPNGAALETEVVIITPFRDEEDHLPRIIAAMTSQTHRPKRWLLVDDGSSDAGPDLVRRAAQEHDWIRMVSRQDRGNRVLGSGVVDAFSDGLGQIDESYEFLAKLDADLSFGPRYLETALRLMIEDPRLAALSGKVFRPEKSGPVEEFMIDDMVTGGFKLYRREAFEEIGGFVRGLFWDGIDYHRCRQSGWKTRSVRHPDLRINHHRLMGSSDRNVLVGRLRLGRGQWFMGTHPLYLIASAVFRALEKPYVIGTFLIMFGYLRSMVRGLPRYENLDFRAELRRWQLSRLTRLMRFGGVR